MKTIILTQFFLSAFIIFNISCSKDSGGTNDKKENDSTSYGDTLQYDTNSYCDSSICSYDSLCLDTNYYVPINLHDLIGTWQLKAYIDFSNCSIVSEPTEIPKAIKITFFENDSVAGHTVSNTFTGKYILNGKKIGFDEILMTEIMEPEWGRKFSEAINYTDYSKISDSYLFIHYKNSTLSMVLAKIKK